MQQRERSTSSGEGRAIILVVERDPHIRELESYFLNEAGFSVDFAADGVAALERARELQPDITYVPPPRPAGEEPFRAQKYFMVAAGLRATPAIAPAVALAG